MKNGFIFPGQGSQKVGMGKELALASPIASAVFAEVDDALGQKLSQLMWDGPEDELQLTENAQPALMAVSMAVVRVLALEHGVTISEHAAYVAGHSLGEYSALAAAGTFSLADTARLLKARGQTMQAATPVGTGAMAALLGLEYPAAAEIAEAASSDGEICQAANDNAPGQVVLSGHKAAVERAIELAKGKGARRAILLPVSAPFHCVLMAPAADVMAQELANVEMALPCVPLVANILAKPISDPAQIRKSLVEQVTGTVRWRESMAFMAGENTSTFYELGAGKVLTGMVKRCAPDAVGVAVNNLDDIAAMAAALKGDV